MRAQAGKGGSYSSSNAAKKKIASLKKTDSRVAATNKAIKKVTAQVKSVKKKVR